MDGRVSDDGARVWRSGACWTLGTMNLALEPTSDNPTCGQTPTRRSESSPAPWIVTAPHRCPPSIRTSTQPPTAPAHELEWLAREACEAVDTGEAVEGKAGPEPT